MPRFSLFRLWLTLLCCLPAFPQSKTTAEIGGTVTDATQSVISGAKVTVTNQETGFTRETTSDAQGEYRVTLLPPGIYEVKTEHTGFSSQTKKGIEVTVGQSATIDVRLEVGASTQMVEIASEAPLIETERTQQANTINETAVRNLPINRRDYLTFALLAPGVADSKAQADSTSFRVKQTPDSGLSFYGSNGRGNNISVDGGEANDDGGGVRPTVSQETVQEFQINRTNYTAEHGGARGGVVNIVTKSGANAVRSSVFAFFRHQDLDAGDPFAITLQGDRVQRIKPPSTRQQFGGTLGGPIKKDRTFWFVGYEQLRRRESASVPVLTDPSIFLPTRQQEAVLSTLPAQLAVPLRGALTSPQSTIDLFRNNSGVFPFQTDLHQGLVRLDHRLNDRNQLNFRFNTTKTYDTNQNVGALIGLSRGFITDQFDVAGIASWTHSFTPAIINEFRGQFDYYDILTKSNEAFGPQIDLAGFGFFNRDRFLPNDTITRRTDLVNNLSVYRGNHNFRAGIQVLVRNNHSESATFLGGLFRFGDLPGAVLAAAVPGAPAAALANLTLNSLQAFNLGLPQVYQQGFGGPIVGATHPLYAGYVQDAWKPASNLTLNFGVRYEVDVRKPPLPTDKNNVAPRVGFAWDPFNDKKTTVRGGYGLFYEPIGFQIDYVVNALGEVNGFRQIAQVLTTFNAANPLNVNGPVNIWMTLRRQGIISVPTPQRTIQASDLRQFGINVSQTGPRPPLTVIFRNSEDYQNPYAQQASFGIEREIASGFSFAASYIFTRGAKLTRSRDANLLPAPVNPAKGIRDWGPTADNPTGTKYFRDPLLFQEDVYESTANSFFHGLILETSKRFSRRVTFAGNYTFSKAIDEELDYNSDFQANDQTNLKAERALSAFDQRHKVVVYGVLQAPPGKDGARKVFGNFVFSPIFRANSGRPFNLLAGVDLNNDRHSTTDRPFFAGRNTGRGPSFWTFDMRLSRRFSFGEHRALELIGEAFNLFNHLNLASVNNTVGNMPGPFNVTGRHDRTPSQPLGFTSAFDARRIQLGFRMTF